MAAQQPYQLLASNPLTPALTDVICFQPNDAGATEMGASTIQGIVDLVTAGQVVTAKVSLSSAEILALNTTPITGIAAPGAGNIIRPLALVTKSNFNTTQYSGNAMELSLGGNFVATTSAYTSSSTNFEYKNASQFGTTTDLTNQPLLISISSANPSGGDGTVDMYITYCIIEL